MNLWKKFFNRKDEAVATKLITEMNNWYSPWGNQLFESDIIRSAIRPKVKAIGKMQALHIREGPNGLQTNPEPYVKLLLEEPNPYSTGQMFREKMVIHLALNNNAFALIYRDENGFPMQLYPINAASVEAIRKEDQTLSLRFRLNTGRVMTVPYSDVIHLRDDFNDNDIFGAEKITALQNVMEVIHASDKSLVEAVKNSRVIRWLLKFKTTLKKEDRDMQVKEFVDSFFNASDGGAIGHDNKYDLDQVKQDTYVPRTTHQEKAIQRVNNLFGVNERIIQAKYTEDEWLAYFESQLEPLAKQMSEEFTRKLFTRRERGHGNKIIFDSTALSFASMATKLNLVRMVDRGAMTPNEWRRILNLPPIAGGDEPIRRLDTAPIEGGEKD